MGCVKRVASGSRDLLCDTRQRNGIHNENQNNINYDDEFIAKSIEEVSKMNKDILNELSNVRHTEIKDRETHKNTKQ